MNHPDELDLGQVVQQQGPLRVPQAVDYLIQAACLLEVAHESGIVHCDVRPGTLMVDSNGIVRVLGLGVAGVVDANDSLGKARASHLAETRADIATNNYRAPEQAEILHKVDHRADIYSLGCTLFYLLTGHEPLPGETVQERLTKHGGPALRVVRPDVPLALEAAFERMVATRPEDRPSSMTEVIALLEASTRKGTTAGLAGDAVSEPNPEPRIVSETTGQRTGTDRPKGEPSSFVRRQERAGLLINHELNLEDLVLDRRPGDTPTAFERTSATGQPLKRSARTRSRWRRPRTHAVILVVGVIALFAAAFVGISVSRRPATVTDNASSKVSVNSDEDRDAQAVEGSHPAPVAETRSIFDGASGQGWMLCNHRPVPPQNIQHDGLNPHSTGSYLVVYDQKLGDFVLDFDYKLSKGCNSGVFLRVSDLNNPIQTGIEVSLDDTRWGDDRDSGGFCGLVAPSVYAQKPAGQWNHMTITAQGSRLAVSLNHREVSSIDLDSWTFAGKRPDGSDHQFKDRAIARMARSGYLGFQDLGGDCWFKNIVLKSGSVGRRFRSQSGRAAGWPLAISPANKTEFLRELPERLPGLGGRGESGRGHTTRLEP